MVGSENPHSVPHPILPITLDEVDAAVFKDDPVNLKQENERFD